MRHTVPLLAALAAALFSSCCSTAPEVTSLFDGHGLDGWTVETAEGAQADPRTFRVEDGMILCKGVPTAVLRTTGEYADYELVLEWRWAPGTEGGNSGLLLHCTTPRYRGVWPRSIEAQLKSGAAAGFYLMGEGVDITIGGDTTRRSGSWIPRTAGAERAVGEWNHMRVRCEGARITVWLNGELANEGWEASESRGAIALQSEGAPIHFRRVELTPL